MNSRLFVLIGLLLNTASSFVLYGNSTSLIQKGPAEKNDKLFRRKHTSKKDGDDSNSLESVVLAIDTGVKHLMAGTRPDVVDNIAKTLSDFAKNSANPIYRTKGREYDIKPEIIHIRSDKPSVMFEVNSKSIIKALKDLLQSKLVQKYMDRFSKEAAVIYRAIKQEMDKTQENEKRF